jgi:hypothetical protein
MKALSFSERHDYLTIYQMMLANIEAAMLSVSKIIAQDRVVPYLQRTFSLLPPQDLRWAP